MCEAISNVLSSHDSLSVKSSDIIFRDTQGGLFLSARYVNSSDKWQRGMFGVLVEVRAAGDSEKQVIREQDESKSYQRRALYCSFVYCLSSDERVCQGESSNILQRFPPVGLAAAMSQGMK